MRGSGGTKGGVNEFLIGFVLALLGTYLFFDSVRVQTGQFGAISSGAHRMLGGGRFGETTSMGIVFIPFFIGVLALFTDASKKWAWYITYIGIAVLVIEILSRIQFYINTKLTHLLGMIVLFAAGAGLMIRSYRDQNSAPPAD
ncbi:MAG: hypothetical protein KDA58_00610 [Planctomycetaceae bacterium]|nr:hypothetical protein [Planctomycetaceae bacterium]